MRRDYLLGKICACCVVILTVILLSQGVDSKNVSSKGPLVNSVKEPPDLQDNGLQQRTLSQLSKSKNSRRGDNSLNQGPIKFLCKQRVPVIVSRRSIPAQKTEAPYVITSNVSVVSGHQLQVNLSSQSGNEIQGFMLQAVSSADGTLVLGQFLATPNVNLQTCYGKDDTVTSDDRSDRYSVALTWMAPTNFSGNITFRGTVVKDKLIYWTNVSSGEVQVIKDTSKSTINADGVLKSEVKQTETVKGNDSSPISIDVRPAGSLEDGPAEIFKPMNLSDQEAQSLIRSVTDTFETINGPSESLDEVLLHQGIRNVDKVDRNPNANKQKESDVPGVLLKAVIQDEAPIAPQPPPRYVYKTMNKYAPNFEPPQTSEFVGNLLSMAAGGGGGGGGGLGSMMNMMGMASNLMGGGGGGGGGMLGPMMGMLGGGRGTRAPPLGMLGSLLGGGPKGPPSGRGGGGGGLLGGLLGGGNRNNNPPEENIPPPNPPRSLPGEPSLADLLGVDPSIVADNNPVAAEVNPAAGVTAAKAGGGLLSSLGGFAPMLAMAPIAFSMMSGKKKNQQQPPFGMPGMQGMPGMPGMQGMPGMPQFGGMPGANGQFGQMQGQFGQMPGAQGQFGMPGQFGGMGQTVDTSQSYQDIQKIIQLLERQQLQIEGLKAQIGGNSITGQMSSFGSSPLSFGQASNAQLLGGLTGGSSLGGLSSIGSTIPGANFAATRPTAAPPSNSANDLLLQQLLQQNQMLMQQNQQFMSQSQAQGQFGGSPVNRVNRSNGLPGIGEIPRSNFDQNTGIGSFPTDSGQFGQSHGTGIGSQFGQTQGMGNGGQFGQTQGMGNGGQFGQTQGMGNGGQFGQTHGMEIGGQSSITSQGGNPFNTGMFGGTGAHSPAGGGSNLAHGGQSSAAESTGGSSLMSMFGGGGGSGGGAHGSPPGGMSSLFGGGAGGGGQSNPMTSLFGGGGGGSGGQGNPMASLFGGGSGGGQGNPMASLFGGGGGGGQGNPMASLFGGGSGGGQGNPMASLLGGGGGGGGGLESLMGNMGSLLGGGGGGGPGGLGGLLGSVDMNAMQGLMQGKEGQDMMNSITGLLTGPKGGNLMKAVEGVMSGKTNPAEIQSLMGDMDVNQLQNLAKQAEGVLASSGINPAQILSMMG